MDDQQVLLKAMHRAIEKNERKSSLEWEVTPFNEEAIMYALASIAESLARIAGTVGNVSPMPDMIIEAIKVQSWE